MSGKKLEVGDVFGWFTSAIQLAMKNPGAFLVMALIMAIIAVIPVLGSLALMVLSPALYGGFIYAAREEEAGRKAEIPHLFIAFQQPGKIGPMLMLCLPSIAGGILIGILGFVFVGGAIMAAASGGNAAGAGFGFGMILFAALAMAISVGIAFLVYFAIPRVMLDSVEPIAAMKESLAYSLANVVPLIVGFIAVGVVFMVAAVVLMFIPILGWIVLALGSVLVGSLSMYFAYKSAFGSSIAQVEPPMPPAPPPVVQ
ncbi:MAG: hypothetical protein IPG63_06565 [Xanthomonadales bacterium]|nr:hypothetical protein [Xanthomonadales bacterium]MBK7143724.1 hypothetical protein [Xanthomonadales bacterium]MCC6560753.1 hypothetical protein [Xanthomonadales bacterium]